MITSLVKKVFGSRNDRIVKKLQNKVDSINRLESEIEKLSDEQLKQKTAEFKENIINKKYTLDDILPEAFALVREASKRTLKLRHFDVQLIGGMVLHHGKITEMGTGEGKTLVATLPAYLNALSGYSVHIVTVNDYLAQRDANWMRPIYELLGLSVGVIISNMEKEEKQQAYKADVVYGTNNEFGFDYLRDNMAFSLDEKVQGKLNYAIVDEVDSILIDEARTPLIISGASEDSSELYGKVDKLIPSLSKKEGKEDEEGPGDYYIDEKSKQAHLTEDGHVKVEELLSRVGLLNEGESLYDASNIMLMHHVLAALKAHTLFQKDVDYIIKDNKVVIVDEHTGRTMDGRRWSDGLHQAVEAKENLTIESENQTLASITFQNYFRLYEKLSGMTGTADTEAYEMQQIYGLEVVVIPTNKPRQRKDLADLIYLTQEEKFKAIIDDIIDCVRREQPVLVGTISIETSEYLSKLLKRAKIEHNVLNAKFHTQEAQIIAEAGRPGKVTIATNMAGRGTDIVLGGNLSLEIDSLSDEDRTDDKINKIKQDWEVRHEKVLEAGGLHIIGTERHESRRIDNQLRGRSGRQGDPGSSQFYLSVKDNLMRIFISDNVTRLLSKLGMEDGGAITHPLVSKSVENAQRKVEGYNFDVRKQLLDFDDVANDQRKVIYLQRSELMKKEDISATISETINEVINNVIASYITPESLEETWDVAGLESAFLNDFGQKLAIKQWLEEDSNLHEESLKQKILKYFEELYKEKEFIIGSENMRHLEKTIMLNILDTSWKEHLSTMDYLRQSIHLRGYAQKDPKQEYKREAFGLFTAMLDGIKQEVVSVLCRIQVNQETNPDEVDAKMRPKHMDLEYKHANSGSILDNSSESQEQEQTATVETFVRDTPKVGRNEPCPCGSGQKYKQCHGKLS